MGTQAIRPTAHLFTGPEEGRVFKALFEFLTHRPISYSTNTFACPKEAGDRNKAGAL